LEITTLIIPDKNDSEKELKQIAAFIKKKLGKDIPWHVSRFFPHHEFLNMLPTPVEKIHQAVEIGKKAGLKFVHAGNI
ncbi:MAG: radical SAM protein, partial [bacterium]|nr:radical SAM protein [bacterium]